MVRTALGGVVAGLVLFFVGFVFWATPLSELAYSSAGETQSAALQASLAQNLTQSGTGAYIIPNPHTAQGTTLYGQGPVAIVHFNSRGFPVDDMGMLVSGFIMAILAGLLIAMGLGAVGGGGRSLAAMVRLIVLFSLGITIWTILAQPVFNHYGWGYWIYSFIAQSTALILAGLVVAKWFLPQYERRAPAEAPAREEPPAREA